MMKKNNPISIVYYVILMVTCLCVNDGILAQRNEIVVVKVGAVLDLSNGTNAVGIIALSCINMALSDFYDSHSHYKTRIQLIVRDTHTDVVTAGAHGTL
jgi:ionotropic glutamate receptor